MIVDRIYVTKGVKEKVSNQQIMDSIRRYENFDWGDLELEDKEANTKALINGDRIVAMYHTENGIKFYIITETDRSISTILLAEEY